jgi:shikimate kinase/3-dehydroquinate synthase
MAKVTTESERVQPPAAQAPTPKLVFVGFMGAGKSRAAGRAAERLGVEALDSDSRVEAELGEPISAFFDREGEAAFREREEAAVLDLLARPDATVIALGGGAVKSERVRERLTDHVCVYLEIDPELAWSRVSDSGRPLARDRGRFVELHAERKPLYESVSRATLPATEGVLPERALDAAIALARRELPRALRMAWAQMENGGYPVYVGAGALDAAGSLWPGPGRSFVVADENVQALHGERLRGSLADGPGLAQTVTVAPGERHKVLAEAERVLRALARGGMERSDTLVALGGGVVGDLAGFCAAVYQRGVAIVQVPTTVVAQVDSAYGGKTGVDLPEAKNYVGAFHQPVAVFTDPDVLATLPGEELRAGFVEVIKTALIAGGELWEQTRMIEPLEIALSRDQESIRRVIESCIRTKLAVVAEDERELGARASLNLGHTFAHALEAAVRYSGYRHGEAVGIGLLVALRLSELELELDPNVRDAVAELLARHGLPRRFEGPSVDELLRYAALDKKRRQGRSNLVLLSAPGHVVTGCDISDQALREAIEEVREVDATS